MIVFRAPSPRRTVRPAVLAVVLAGGLWASSGCHRQPPAPAAVSLPPVAVKLVAVEAHGLTAVEEVVGTVRAKLRAAVEAKLAGRVETLLVAPGQTVKRGDLLATLEAREALARLDSAQAVREQATRDWERVGRLVRDGAATVAELDAVLARQRVAAAAVVEAETMVGHARVVAPFDGVITRKLADLGDLATPGRPLLELEDPQRLRFEADVPEALLERLQLGAKLPVRLAALKEPVEGVVGEIAPVAEAVSRTFLVKLELPFLPGVRAGQFGRMAVSTGEAAVPHVPAAAIFQRGQLEYVFVADGGYARLRLIRTGKHFGREVEIVAGLNVAERVIVEGGERVQDGQPVEVQP